MINFGIETDQLFMYKKYTALIIILSKNEFISHRKVNVSLQYTTKRKLRNLPAL